MIEESLFKTNFVGRDGFRWWVGQIAPIESWESQANGGGWGSRYKVRIMGYHPDNETDLKNEDLPWAGVLMPTTTGSGGANLGVNSKLAPGDVVVGFFLDGDDGQIPMIMGTFGRTGDIIPKPYKAPFEPFTGYTDKIKKPNGLLDSSSWSESVSSNTKSSKTPRSVDQKTASRLNTSSGSSTSTSTSTSTATTTSTTSTTVSPISTPTEPKEISSSSAIGTTIVLADTCEDTLVKGISAEVNNLLNKIQNAATVFLNIDNELNKSVEVISSLANGFVGQMMNKLYNKFEKLLSEGLELLYKTTFGSILTSSGGNTVTAHLGAVAAQKAMMSPVKIFEDAIACISSKVVEGLKSIVKDLLKEIVKNITNFVTCVGNQFVGAFLNKIIDDMVSGLSSAISGLSKILSPAFKVAEFLRSGVDVLKALGGLFDCDQGKGKCPEVKEIVVGKGPKKSDNEKDSFDKILENMNASKAIGNLASDFERQYGKWDIFGDGTKVSGTSQSLTGGCYSGPCSNNGGPQVKIFGGGGSGAVGKALLGSFVNNVDGLGNVVNAAQKTASVIGVQIDNPGSGYKFPPFVELVDECGQGYGAIARALIDENGQVASIYIVSPGENYPVEDSDPYGVSSVVISDPGNGYLPTDTAVDSFGTEYELIVDSGRIISAKPINSQVIDDVPVISVISDTGDGALLRPVLGVFPQDPQTEVQQVIDCIT